jgi:pSer/pThr/pTyr-binding forkhead associated (FHA) protein
MPAVVAIRRLFAATGSRTPRDMIDFPESTTREPQVTMPAHLLSLTDGPSVQIDKPILLFGRHEECDVQLNSKKVSRRHCVVAQVNDSLIVRDLGSTNGVRINGQRVAEGKLKPGDELQIGNFKYQVCGDPLGRSKEQPVADEFKSVPPSDDGEN